MISQTLFNIFLRGVPEHLLAGVRSGELGIFGSVIRTVANGQIAGFLKEKGFQELFVCGLATDFCVAWTALDARATGFEVTVLEDACRAIDLEGSAARAWADMRAAGVTRTRSSELPQ